MWATFLLHRLPFHCTNDFTFDIGPFVYSFVSCALGHLLRQTLLELLASVTSLDSTSLPLPVFHSRSLVPAGCTQHSHLPAQPAGSKRLTLLYKPWPTGLGCGGLILCSSSLEMGSSEVHFVELLRCLRSIKKWPAQGDPRQISRSMNVSLFGKRVIAGVIKLWILRLSWFTWVGSNFNDKCLFQSDAEAHLRQKKRQIQGVGGGDVKTEQRDVWPQAKECQQPQRLGQATKDSSLEALEGVWLCWHLDLRFFTPWNCEKKYTSIVWSW